LYIVMSLSTTVTNRRLPLSLCISHQRMGKKYTKPCKNIHSANQRPCRDLLSMYSGGHYWVCTFDRPGNLAGSKGGML